MRRWGISLSMAVAWVVGSFAGSAYAEGCASTIGAVACATCPAPAACVSAGCTWTGSSCKDRALGGRTIRDTGGGRNVGVTGEAWLHGIPGDTTPGGLRVEVVTAPARGRVTLTLKMDDRVSHTLHTLLKNKDRLNMLKLVVREGPQITKEVVYTLGGVSVGSINTVSAHAQSLDLTFINVESSVNWGLTQNPGPPAGAPAVETTGRNKGWMHLPDLRGGIPLEVVEFTPPEGSGLLRVVFGGDTQWQQVQRLLPTGTPLGRLILVLPDREHRRYVEYKLSDADVASRKPVTFSPNQKGFVDQEVVFQSHAIEYLRGEDSLSN